MSISEGGENVAYGEKEMTEHEEHLIAVKIARMLSKEGVSVGRAERILEDIHNEIKKIPLTEW